MSYGSMPPFPGPPGQPGWGGWAPAPPKPGVVPLGPLGLGEILGGAFTTIGRHWKQLLGMAFAAYGMALAVVALGIGVVYLALADRFHRVVDPENSSDWDDVAPLVFGFGAVYLFGLFTVLVANALLYAGCPAILQDAVLGRPTSFGTVWRRSVRRVWSVLGTVLLTALIAAVPMLLLGAVVVTAIVTLATTASDGGGHTWLILLCFVGALATGPLAVWLWVKFCLAAAAAVFEGQGSIAAMRRSAHLVRGDWWRIFGTALLAHGMAVVASYLVQLPFSFLSAFGPSLTDDVSSGGTALALVITTAVFSLFTILLGQILTSAFPQLVVGLLYVDQRIRKENLGPALAQAAGAPPFAAH